LSLDYALITSSSLPDEIKSSDYYVEVDKQQWLDLIEYSEDLINSDPTQKVLFLIVAKGTPEQEKADAEKKQAKILELEKLKREKDNAQQQLTEKEMAEQALREAEQKSRDSLRKKSESIFNALYKR
jgi:hypothetical protein